MATDLSTASQSEVAATPPSEAFVLPAKIVWLWGIGPPLLAPMIVPEFWLRPLRLQLSIVASFYLAFFGIGAVLHGAYAKLQPQRLQRPASLTIVLLLHALFTACVVAPSALSIQPLYCLLNYGTPTSAQIDFCLHGIKLIQRLEFLWTSLVVAWGCVLPAVIMHTLHRDRAAIEHRLQQEQRSRLHAQLTALQSRLHPHFLFNSLNTIACLISEDPVAAERVVERLAELLRYSLQDAGKQTVPLRDELSIVSAYLSVQSARFGPRLRYELVCPSELHAASVPPLSLLSIVENAVLHGAIKQRGGGSVVVRAEVVDSALRLSVQDDGPGVGGSAHQGNGLALGELRERLRILYPSARPPAKIELLSPQTGPGCLAVLTLPLDLAREQHDPAPSGNRQSSL